VSINEEYPLVGEALYQMVASLYGEGHLVGKRDMDSYSKDDSQDFCNYDLMSIKALVGHT
jgi:hypothetical protein